jgi:hypothetical protein
MSRRRTAVVGLLLISSRSFAVGEGLVEAYLAEGGSGRLLAGVLLQGYPSVAVAAIGVAPVPILRPYGQRLAAGHVVLRAVEGVAVLAACAHLATGRRGYAALLISTSLDLLHVTDLSSGVGFAFLAGWPVRAGGPAAADRQGVRSCRTELGRPGDR